MAPEDPAVAVTRAYDLALWLLPKVEKMPRSYRFTVGERITKATLDLLLALVDASYARDKAEPLRKASAAVNALRFLLRLAKDLRMLPVRAYHFGAGRIDEIGRMVGGWARAWEGRGETRR